MQKILFTLLVFSFCLVRITAQRMSIELSSKQYHLVDKPILADDDFEYEKYSVSTPIDIGFKYYLEQYFYLKSGIGIHKENLERHTKTSRFVSGRTLLSSQRLIQMELPLAAGLNKNLYGLNFFIEGGFIVSNSLHYKYGYYANPKDYKLSGYTTNRRFIDQNTRLGFGIKLYEKSGCHLVVNTEMPYGGKSLILLKKIYLVAFHLMGKIDIGL